MMRVTALYRTCRIAIVITLIVIIITLLLTRDDAYVSKYNVLDDTERSRTGQDDGAQRSAEPTNISIRVTHHYARPGMLSNLTYQQVKEMNLSLVRNKLNLPPFVVKPSPAKIADFAYDYADLKDVELLSLDGKFIYDEDITMGRPDRTGKIPFGRLSAKERMDLLKKLRNKKYGDTVRIAGHGEFPNCNMSYIMESLNNDGDYMTARTCNNILFTRVPGSGSTLFMYLFSALQTRKSDQSTFYLMSEEPPNNPPNNFLEGNALTNLVDLFETVDKKLVYARHIPFVNFTKVNPSAKEPVYLSVVREPYSRLIAEYLFHRPPGSRKPKQTFEKCVANSYSQCTHMSSAVTYFCGHEEICRNSSSRAMLAIAKRTVSERYLSVGLYSDIGTFTAVLRMMLPNFFQNAPAKLQMALSKRHSPDRAVQAVHRTLTEATKNILRARPEFALEIEFYQFLQQRFYSLYNLMTKRPNRVKVRGGKRV